MLLLNEIPGLIDEFFLLVFFDMVFVSFKCVLFLFSIYFSFRSSKILSKKGTLSSVGHSVQALFSSFAK